MPHLPSLALPTFAALCLLAGAAVAQVPQELQGAWTGTGATNRGERLEIGRDSITIGDRRLSLKQQAPGVLVIGGDDGDRAEYAIAGTTLTLTVEGESRQFERAAAPAAGGAGNPLGRRAAADPFVRTFRGKDIELALAGDATAGYRGKLVFQGVEYPAEATAREQALTGRFRAGQGWFEFTAKLDGDKLRLESGGGVYDLGAPPVAAPAEPANPLGRGTGGGAGGEPTAAAAPPALDGVFAGATRRFDHPRGWFSFDMPEGWTVHSEDGTGMLINPGLRATDTLDAIVGLSWGRLEKDDQDLPVAKVIGKRLPQLRQFLEQQGLPVGEPDGEITTWRGKDVPGAVVVLRGATQTGQKLQVWFGGIKKRDGWIAVSGVILEGKEAAFLPKVKRIFTSLEPRPPERNARAEAALAGATFASSQYGKATGSGHHASYTFAADGTVNRRLMSFVPSQPGLPGASADAERTGRFEVCGDVLYLYFETGQETGQVVLQGAQAAAIRIGSAEYPRQ